MHNQSYVFAQLALHLNRSKFNRVVAKYQSNKHIKNFSCWNQLKVRMFGQLSRRESLRDLIVAVEAHSGKAKFLGFGESVTRSNLAKANQNKDCHIFNRAYNFFTQLHRFHCAGAFFVVRAKKNLQYKAVRWKRRMPKNILSDSIIELTTYKSHNDYSAQLRRVEYYDEEQDRYFVFLTNAMDITALEVALLYKNRWSVELFQMGEAASENQKVLGRLRKCSPHPDLHRDYLLLLGSHCSPQNETQNVCLQHASSAWNLAHRYDSS